MPKSPENYYGTAYLIFTYSSGTNSYRKEDLEEFNEEEPEIFDIITYQGLMYICINNQKVFKFNYIEKDDVYIGSILDTTYLCKFVKLVE
jgi:hypothetical protein